MEWPVQNDECSTSASGSPSAGPGPNGAEAWPSPALRAFFAVADGMAALFQPFVEVVVHDLHTDSVAYVVQPFSPREVGDPSDLRGSALPAGTRVVGPYEKVNWDGRRIKSISVVLRDATETPIGLLCMNADLTEFDAARRMLQGFLGMAEPASPGRPSAASPWTAWIARRAAP
jgi:predicted transcriptional regulator YheO